MGYLGISNMTHMYTLCSFCIHSNSDSIRCDLGLLYFEPANDPEYPDRRISKMDPSDCKHFEDDLLELWDKE